MIDNFITTAFYLIPFMTFMIFAIKFFVFIQKRKQENIKINKLKRSISIHWYPKNPKYRK
jgi:hypothetical protein